MRGPLLLLAAWLLAGPGLAPSILAAAFEVGAQERLGEVAWHRIASDAETLVDLALRHDLGYNEIAAANPDFDPWYPGAEARVLIPTSWLLPETEPPASWPAGLFHAIELGSYAGQPEAIEAATRLRPQLPAGEQALLRLEERGDRHGLQLGPFADRSQARQRLADLGELAAGSRVVRSLVASRRPAAGEASSVSRLVVNLAELRLYLLSWHPQGLKVTTFPIGIGREGFDTATGRFRIVEKIRDPSWTVPPSIRAEKPELPARVPPGPNNPLGRHALRLSSGDVLLHGTNKPLGVGRRVSHGCMRLYPRDIATLYDLVEPGLAVEIVYQPVKAGIAHGVPYVEVHEDFMGGVDLGAQAEGLLRQRGVAPEEVDEARLRQALAAKTGVPVPLAP
ncbi:MAG: L,D-transpeptidase family protein [Thermodesulfobacteriota bacterium]